MWRPHPTVGLAVRHLSSGVLGGSSFQDNVLVNGKLTSPRGPGGSLRIGTRIPCCAWPALRQLELSRDLVDGRRRAGLGQCRGRCWGRGNLGVASVLDRASVKVECSCGAREGLKILDVGRTRRILVWPYIFQRPMSCGISKMQAAPLALGLASSRRTAEFSCSGVSERAGVALQH